MRAMRGLQTPHAITTYSASTSPRSVRTRRTRPPSTSMPSTSVFADTVSAPASCASSRMSVPGAQRVDHADALRVEAADDHALVDEGHELLDLGRA